MRRKKLLGLVWVLLLGLGSGTIPKQPLKADPDNGGLALPDGFEALVVVDSLAGRARHIAVNSNGDIYVKLRFPDSIGGNVAIRDTDGDGRADEIVKFADYQDRGSYGTAMRIYNGYIYFSSETFVYRQKLHPTKLVPDGPIETIVIDDHAHGRHEHIAKPVTFDKKGNMYVAYGAPNNNCQERNRVPGSPGINPCPWLEDHGGIWKFDANKHNQTQKDGTLYATGLRSVVGMDWNMADDALYVVHHGRDDLHRLYPDIFTPWQSAMLPSEEFLKVKEGDDAGWPYYYYDQMVNKRILAPEYGGDGKIADTSGKYIDPLIGFPGHWAPNDIMFYTGDQFPERYKNGAFIAFHGSTNRAPYPQAGYIIVFVPFKNNKPTGEWEVFADGFAEVDPIVNVNNARYRPMGLSQGPDGSLYISDTEYGKIWRVFYTGKRKFGKKQLAAMEERKKLAHIRTPHIEKDNLEAGLVSQSEIIYNRFCSGCHQKNGQGDGNRFPPLGGTDWVTGDKNRLIRLVLMGMDGPIEVNGKPYNSNMPQHRFLKDEDIAQVLTYIRQNFGNQASEITPAEVSEVRKEISNQTGSK
ncbi:MAG TPA: c-type cytochrome [Flavihumibacter sp.]|jgi:glucose/arabinose dehydrogenase/mono/diheme cytochrome c family protein